MECLCLGAVSVCALGGVYVFVLGSVFACCGLCKSVCVCVSVWVVGC